MRSPTFAAADSLRAAGMSVPIDCQPRCQMCEVSEHQVYLAREEMTEVNGTAILAIQDRKIAMGIMREAKRDAAKWESRFWLALLAFGLTFGFAVYAGGCR